MVAIPTSIIFFILQVGFGFGQSYFIATLLGHIKLKIFYAAFTAAFCFTSVLAIISFGVGVSLSKYKPDPVKDEENQSLKEEEKH